MSEKWMPIFPRHLRLAVMLWAACLWLCGSSLQLSAAPMSIEEFVASRAEWPEWSKKKSRIRVEGRLASHSREVLQFRRCEILFRATEGVAFPRVMPTHGTVEVRGVLVRQNQKLLFQVHDLIPLSSDVETVRLREGEIRGEKADAWQTIGDWAYGRGKFYEDAALIKLGLDARLKSFRIQRERVKLDDPEALIALSSHARKMQLDEAVWQEPLHTAYQIRWRRAKGTGEAELLRLAELIRRDFPGTDEPMNPPQPRLREKYLADANGVYQNSDAPGRRKLHRLFYGEVRAAALLSRLMPDESNGFLIAAEIDRHVPELHPQAEDLRAREIAGRFKRLPGAPRDHMLALATLLRGQNRAADARRAIETWLKTETRRLRDSGAGGLIRAADEYLALLEDDKTAAALLIESHRLHPDGKEAGERLAKLGFAWREGRWLNPQDAKRLPDDPVKLAIRSGEIVPGMSAEQVRQALGGSPISVARFASSNKIEEVWIYGTIASPTYVVHLVRRAKEPRSEARVKLVFPPRAGAVRPTPIPDSVD